MNFYKKWIWIFSIGIALAVFCIAVNILDIVVNHHFPIGAPFNVLSLFIIAMLLDDMLELKMLIKEKGH